MSYYDLVIVGGGPAGLALAHCCSRLHKKILVIDKEHTIGGCHRVKRVHNGMFTEHGPRIYLSIYLNFFYLLSEIGIKQDDIFKNNYATIVFT
jgi:phytoene dehydrogenase-like protein